MEIIFLLIILLVLGITNFIAFKVSGKNRKKRIWAGLIILLLTPLVFFVTGISVSPFDPSGFGTGMLMVSYSFLFAINGIIIIIIGIFTKRSLNS
jgi:hypothetical protein